MQIICLIQVQLIICFVSWAPKIPESEDLGGYQARRQSSVTGGGDKNIFWGRAQKLYSLDVKSEDHKKRSLSRNSTNSEVKTNKTKKFFFRLHRDICIMPVDTLYRTSIISSLTALPLNPFANLSLAPLSLFSIYGPDFEVLPDCWVSAEFLRAPIPRKGSGSTTTTTNTSA